MSSISICILIAFALFTIILDYLDNYQLLVHSLYNKRDTSSVYTEYIYLLKKLTIAETESSMEDNEPYLDISNQ